MEIDIELEKELITYINNRKLYSGAKDFERDLGYKRSYLSYRGIDITKVNKKCGYVRRIATRIQKSNLSKEEVIEKIKIEIRKANRYLTRSELKVRKIGDHHITQHGIDVHYINLELGFYKDSPMSRIDIRRLTSDIEEYIDTCQRYVCQQEISDIFKVSIPFLTKSDIDTVKINFDKGFGPDYSFFERRVYEVISRYFSDITLQKTFDKCRSKKNNLLRFDFYIEKYKLAIEADGNQHRNTDHEFYSEDMHYNDIKKDTYCMEKGIHLIRIPFYDRKSLDLEYIKTVFLESLKSLITTAGLEMVDANVRKELGLDNQQPSS